MFAEVLKFRFPLLAATLPPLAVVLFFALSDWSWRIGLGSQEKDAAVPISISEMKRLLAQERQLLATYESEQALLRREVINKRQLFQQGASTQDQVMQAERSFVAALKRVHALRESVTETDIAITEAVLGEKVLRMPVLPVGGFSQTAELTRFNGGIKWSIKEASRVEKYFAQTFGRSLPVTARGQSRTHSRFGLDHRDGMDVGLHPDSTEGRQLIEYLRKSGIPFLAFRRAMPGASTGPHIHIGKPSARLTS